MNGKKAKQLRRECVGIPKMTQPSYLAIFEWFREPTKKPILKKVGKRKIAIQVNHYKNAKSLYKGSVKKAVKAAISFASILEARGKYKFA